MYMFHLFILRLIDSIQIFIVKEQGNLILSKTKETNQFKYTQKR